MSSIVNIAASLSSLAARDGQRIAMHCPGRDGCHHTALGYRELDARSDAIAAGLRRHGIGRGARTVVMLRPTPEFFLSMFALFKLGAVPVLVDPGIDKRALKHCLEQARPQAFIGIPLAHCARALLGWAKTARLHITTGARARLADLTLAEVEAAGAGTGPQLAATSGEDVAAILFTSGSTGLPKGVVYRHRHFLAQLQMLRDAFQLQPGGVDLATFPPFALFAPGLGLTAVIPDMDPTRPARADPRKLHAAMCRFGATQMFGSPALMRVLAEHSQAMPGVRRVLSAGAPVPAEVVARMMALLPQGAQFWTPYGATECLPVAAIEGRELLALRARAQSGAGTCVGRPVAPNLVRIIRVGDAPIMDWSDDLLADPNLIGEITVAGPTATDAYFNRDEQTRLAKIHETLPDGSVRVVHRMGDLGYFDREGRLWFCGRKSQRVIGIDGTLCTEQVEPVFNAHPQVRRTALVGLGAPGAQQAWLCVEPEPGVGKRQWPRIERELQQLRQRHPHTARVIGFLLHPFPFPVDIRHNAKIGREKLAAWAARRVRRGQ